MNIIKSLNFNDLPEWAQDQIARELVDDFDQGYDPKDYESMSGELVELDPNDNTDFCLLSEWLDQKISDEGNCDESALIFLKDNLNVLLEEPSLILSNYCREGRHRIQTSINELSIIRAYVF